MRVVPPGNTRCARANARADSSPGAVPRADESGCGPGRAVMVFRVPVGRADGRTFTPPRQPVNVLLTMTSEARSWRRIKTTSQGVGKMRAIVSARFTLVLAAFGVPVATA